MIRANSGATAVRRAAAGPRVDCQRESYFADAAGLNIKGYYKNTLPKVCFAIYAAIKEDMPARKPQYSPMSVSVALHEISGYYNARHIVSTLHAAAAVLFVLIHGTYITR